MGIEAYLKKKQLQTSFVKNDSSIDNQEIKTKIVQAVKEKISGNNDIDIFNIVEAKSKIQKFALQWIESEIASMNFEVVLTIQDKYDIQEMLMNNLFGLGVIEPLLNDNTVTEIMINGKKNIFYEKSGILYRAKDRKGNALFFSSDKELKNVIDKIVSPINRKVDESNPVVDARLPDGSRVNVVLNPIALDGASVTIRKFPDKPYTMEELINFGALPKECARILEILVKSKYNIIVSGGTGSGKTTFLNALSMFIEEKERIITIEDSAELKFSQVDNIVRLETRPSNIEGKGEIDIRSLVRTALRMRPDRIIVGEIRGGESIDMLQAMNTGHDGSLSTGHANSAQDMLMRLETMVLMSGMELPVSAIRSQINSAVDLIVHLSKMRDGSRKVVQIMELQGIENKQILARDIYRFKEEVAIQQEQVLGEIERTEHPFVRTKKLKSSVYYEEVKLMLQGDME